MKRDLDLIKAILLEIEKKDDTSPISNLSVEGYDQKSIDYNIHLLNQAGLIKANIARVGANEIYDPIILEMTWSGHEFLDSARNETVWNKGKELIKQHGGSVPFEVLKSVLNQVALSLIT